MATPDDPSPVLSRRSPPHIFHIVADDLGYNDLSGSQTKAAHLHALRLAGVDLTNFYSFKTCGPSRASILTGRYPFNMGIYSNADIDSYGLPTNFTLLPTLLKQHGGYATHAVCAAEQAACCVICAPFTLTQLLVRSRS